MADSQKHALRVDFERNDKLAFYNSPVISDARLLAYWELDDSSKWSAVQDGCL
jgi:hypothetical protein